MRNRPANAICDGCLARDGPVHVLVPRKSLSDEEASALSSAHPYHLISNRYQPVFVIKRHVGLLDILPTALLTTTYAASVISDVLPAAPRRLPDAKYTATNPRTTRTAQSHHLRGSPPMNYEFEHGASQHPPTRIGQRTDTWAVDLANLLSRAKTVSLRQAREANPQG